MKFSEEQNYLLAKLAEIKNAQERLAYLLDRARHRPPLEPQFRTEMFRVEGCLSKLWIVGKNRDGKCHFETDSDSLVVKSLAGLLCDLYSGHTPEEIVETDPSFLKEVGITQHLTPNRRDALSRLWEKIRSFAQNELNRGRTEASS